jgi:DmsE family decaheme c-type cytochrome
MPERSSKPDRVAPVIALSLVCAMVMAVASSANSRERADQTKGQTAKPAPAPEDFAGQDTCLTCHEDHNYKGTLHGLAANGKTPAATRGCESCHGPGKEHAESGGDASLIVNPAKLKPQAASEVCVTCHNRASSGTLNPQRALHALWAGSQHDQRNLGCVSCHSVHAPKGPAQIKAANELQLCSTCHRAIVNKQLRLNHMPVREGSMACSSCHNPHGSTNIRMLKAGTTIDESCQSCHADKRGPYLWEHAPVSESCVTCHDPHGSNNNRMLVSRLPFLCQRCHVTSRHPPTVYEGYLLNNSANGNKLFGRSCTVCHQMIHGSNAPSGKALLR